MWREMDPVDPMKVVTHEIYESVSATIPWISRNGLKGNKGSEIKDRKFES